MNTIEIQKANDDGEPSGTAGVPYAGSTEKAKVERYRRCCDTLLSAALNLGAAVLFARTAGRLLMELAATGTVERRLHFL